MRQTICNATPLINFSAIERLDILHQLFTVVVIPQAVYKETIESPFFDINSIKDAIEEKWLLVQKVESISKKINLQLDRGEAEVITLGLGKNKPLLLLDEREARKQAKDLKLDVIGTLGILLLAKQQTVVETVQPWLDQMINKAQYWVNPKLYDQVLKQAGESFREP